MKYREVIEEPYFTEKEFKPIHGFAGAAVISAGESYSRRRAFFSQCDEVGIEPALFRGFRWGWDDIEKMGMLEKDDEYTPTKELVQCYEEQPKFDGHLGHVGCTASHIKIISEAKRLGLSSIIIFEDDAWFTPNWNELLNAASKDLHERGWHMLYLGTCPSRPCDKVTDNIARCRGAWSTPAYAVNHEFYDRILKRMEHRAGAIDCFYYHDAHNPDFYYYISTQCLNYQRHPKDADFSLISGWHRDWEADHKMIEEHYDEFVRKKGL